MTIPTAINPTIAVDAQIGHWRILSITHKRALCRCRCGTTREVSIDALQDGTSLSCGCAALSKDKSAQVFRLPSWRPERGR